MRDLAENAATIAPRGFPSAVPPALRPSLLAERLLAATGGPDAPLLPGPSQGRPNKTTMRRCYDRHGVPDSLRAIGAREQEDDHDIAAELGLDGRDVLIRLNPYSLFAH